LPGWCGSDASTDSLALAGTHWQCCRAERAGGLPSISVAGKAAAALNSSFTAQHHKAGAQQAAAHARQQQQQPQAHQPQARAGRNAAPTADAVPPAAAAVAAAAAAGLDTGPGAGEDLGLNCQLPGLPDALAATFAAESDALAGTLDKNTLPPISASFSLAGKHQPLHPSYGHGAPGHAVAGAGGHLHPAQHGAQQGGGNAGNSTSRRMSHGLPAVAGAGGGQQGLLHTQGSLQQPGALGPEPSASKLGPAGGKANSRAAGAQHQQHQQGQQQGHGSPALAAGKVSRAQANAASTLTAGGAGGFGGGLQANMSVSSIFKQGQAAGAAKGGKYVSPYSQRSMMA
jgi:hypothetical protein